MASNSLLPTMLRSLGTGFALGAAALIAVSQTGAQAISGYNSSAPVAYAADRIELQDKQNRVVLSGNVEITQGDLHLRAARTSVAYTNEGGLKIQRIDATGGVAVTRGAESAAGEVAIYDFNRRIITLVGNVALNRGSDRIDGGRLVIDLATGRSSIDGHAGGGAPGLGTEAAPSAPTGGSGRVTGTFAVPKRTN